MAETLPAVLNKLKTDTIYVRLFKTAFADGIINSQHLLKALAQFTGSIQSYNAKYDKVNHGEATFTISETMGYKDFIAHCNACHKERLFTDNAFRNNGLTLIEKLKDYGRMSITVKRSGSLKFKVPGLINCNLTFSCMHDGKLYTLGKVIDYYRTGIDTTQPTLDMLLKKRITTSDQEKTDLLTFLLTLKDEEIIPDARFQQPN